MASDRTHHRYLLALAASLLLGLGAVLALNFLVDPWQYYRRPTFYRPVYLENDRMLNPGLARTQDYEIAVIGNSHSQNFLPGDVATYLKGQGLKLSLEGSTPYEQRRMIEVVLQAGKAKRLLWILDTEKFWLDPDGKRKASLATLPLWLYQPNWQTHWQMLASLDTAESAIKVLLGRGQKKLADHYVTWHTRKYGPDRVIGDWDSKSDPTRNSDNMVIEKFPGAQERNLRQNVVALISAHPEVSFDLVLPPFSQLYLVAVKSLGAEHWQRYLTLRQQLVSELADLPNVRIYDFQPLAEITGNWENYRDLNHFHLSVNHTILATMAEDRERLTQANVQERQAQIEAQVADLERQLADPGHPWHAIVKRPLKTGQ